MMKRTSDLDFYSPYLLRKMVKSLGFRLNKRRIASGAFKCGYRDYVELIPLDVCLAHLTVYPRAPTGPLRVWVSRRQAFDQLCTTIDGFELVDQTAKDASELIKCLRNPFKGSRSREELELKLALSGGA